MAYPALSTAASGVRNSLWFIVVQPAGLRVCQTQGKSFVRRLQTELRDTFGIRSMPTHGFWDRNVGEALAEVVGRLGPNGVYIPQVDAGVRASGFDDEAGRIARLRDASRREIVTDEAMRLAVWVAYLCRTPNRPESVQLPVPMVFPPWAGDPGDDSASLEPYYGARCYDKRTLDAEIAATPPPPPPPPVTPGVPTPPPPVPPLPRTPTVSLAAVLPNLPGTTSTMNLVYVGAGVAAAGFLLYKMNQPKAARSQSREDRGEALPRRPRRRAR